MRKKIEFRIKKLTEAVTLLSVELLLVFIAFAISLTLLIIIIRYIFYNKETVIDQRVFDYLSQHVTPANTFIMQGFTFLGSHQFLIPAFLLLFIFYFFIRRNKWYFIKTLTIAVSNLALVFGLKFFFNRPRPLIPLLKEVPGLSFPSGHAFMSLSFFGLLMYIVYRDVPKKWLKWVMIIGLGMIILLVGLSRVYLRVHYASDVIAGYCFGILSLIIQLLLLQQIERFNAKKIPKDLNITRTEEGSPGKDPILNKG